MSPLVRPLVRPLGPLSLVHGIPVQPVTVHLLDHCQLTITVAPPNTALRLAAVRNTLLYNFLGDGVCGLTDYTGISEEISGHRVITSLRQRVSQLRPAALSTLTRPQPYGLDLLLAVEAATLRYRTMHVRALNVRTSAADAISRLTPAQRALADALGRQIADAISVYAHDSRVNVAAWRLRNARDHAAALLHRLGGRAVDTHQLVAMLNEAGATQNSVRQDYVTRRDLIQREDDHDIRVGHVQHGKVVVFYPAGVTTPDEALADYAAQRAVRPHGRLPIPAPATTDWCRCQFCTPTTVFDLAGPRTAAAAAPLTTPTGVTTAVRPAATAGGHRP